MKAWKKYLQPSHACLTWVKGILVRWHCAYRNCSTEQQGSENGFKVTAHLHTGVVFVTPFILSPFCGNRNMFSGKTAALKYSLVWPEPKRRKWKVQLAGHHANTKHINDFLTVMAAWILRRKVQISSDAGVHKESGFHACSEQLNFCCALLIAVTF